MPTMNYSGIYLSRYGRINFVVKLQRFVTERDKDYRGNGRWKWSSKELVSIMASETHYIYHTE